MNKAQLYLNVGSDGRIVIPKNIREELGISKNSKVKANVENGILHILPSNHSLAKARNLVKKICKSGPPMVDEFIESRREEAKLEAEKQKDYWK
jgi:AbrB family looped-hinge helix DNA binding protein